MGFSSEYCDLLADLLDRGVVQANERTGARVKVRRGGASVLVDLSDGRLPVPGNRRVFPGTAAAEIAWFLMGTRDVTWLRSYAPIWDKFVEEDGKTIDAAYGYRWCRHFGRDQVQCAVTALHNDPSDRRVVISAWDPAQDGLGRRSKNVPCPTHLALHCLGDELHASVFLRSSDAFVGLPYDVMGHALLVSAMARELGRAAGTVRFTMAHLHLYEAHWDMAEHSLQFNEPLGPTLPWTTLSAIGQDPEGYVEQVKSDARQAQWPSFNPRPEVVA